MQIMDKVTRAEQKLPGPSKHSITLDATRASTQFPVTQKS